MRFHVAMDSLEKEVKIWRLSVIALLILSICLCLGILQTAQRNPLLIERGCISRTVDPVDPALTAVEIQNFVALAIEQRFNSREKQNHYLSS